VGDRQGNLLLFSGTVLPAVVNQSVLRENALANPFDERPSAYSRFSFTADGRCNIKLTNWLNIEKFGLFTS